MAGLLYKDFVAVHGKIFVAVLLIITAFLAVFSISPLPAVADYSGAIIAGALVSLAAMLLPMVVVMSVENNVIAADDGAGKKAYLMSLPVSKRQYVASKYIFILICYYVILSVLVIWVQFVSIHMEKAMEDNFLMNLIGLSPLWIQTLLLVSAMELPFLINMGVRAGTAIKTGIMAVLMYAIFAYMLFGDMTVLENFNLMAMLEWLEEHAEVTMTLQVLGPVIVSGLYYLSYRIAAALFERGERGDEE